MIRNDDYCSMSRWHAGEVTHYLRHQCEYCHYHAVFALCVKCANQIKAYTEDTPWNINKTFCPKCGRKQLAKDVWLVYAPVPSYE